MCGNAVFLYAFAQADKTLTYFCVITFNYLEVGHGLSGDQAQLHLFANPELGVEQAHREYRV